MGIHITLDDTSKMGNPFRSSAMFTNEQINTIQSRLQEAKLALAEAQRSFSLGMPLTSATKLNCLLADLGSIKSSIYQVIEL